MSYTNDWSDTVPIDHTKFKDMPGAVRTLRDDIEDRFSNLFYGFISGETQTQEGIKVLPYVAQSADPGGTTAKMKLYSKYATNTANYVFTVSSANATLGAVYTNNGQSFTVLTTIAGATTLSTNGTGAPTASGTLTKSSGTGDSTITYSSYSPATFPAELFAEDEESNVIQVTKQGALNSTPLATILSTIFYVGALFMETTGVNPATTFGFGTWILWGAGRIPVGVDTSDYVFVITSGNATVGATYTNNGQTFTVKQTIAGGLTLQTSGTGAPAASGTLTKASGTGDSTLSFSSFYSDFGTVEATGGEKTHILSISEIPAHSHLYGSADNTNAPGGINGTADNTDQWNTSSVGGGQAHNNLPPYITCYMWKRIA